MGAMRTPHLLVLLALSMGCGSRPPIDRTVVGQGNGFSCYRHQIPDSQYFTDFCYRTQDECESSRTHQNTSKCAAAAHAFCFTFLEGGRKTMHCFGAKKNCESDARAYAERTTDVSRCEEL